MKQDAAHCSACGALGLPVGLPCPPLRSLSPEHKAMCPLPSPSSTTRGCLVLPQALVLLPLSMLHQSGCWVWPPPAGDVQSASYRNQELTACRVASALSNEPLIAAHCACPTGLLALLCLPPALAGSLPVWGIVCRGQGHIKGSRLCSGAEGHDCIRLLFVAPFASQHNVWLPKGSSHFTKPWRGEPAKASCFYRCNCERGLWIHAMSHPVPEGRRRSPSPWRKKTSPSP